jgi:hypothetical protein
LQKTCVLTRSQNRAQSAPMADCSGSPYALARRSLALLEADL